MSLLCRSKCSLILDYFISDHELQSGYLHLQEKYMRLWDSLINTLKILSSPSNENFENTG